MSFENLIRNINYISWNWYGDYIYIFSFININCFSLTEQFNSIKNSKWLNRLLARMFSRRGGQPLDGTERWHFWRRQLMRRSRKHCRIYIGSQNSSTNPGILLIPWIKFIFHAQKLVDIKIGRCYNLSVELLCTKVGPNQIYISIN